jgi:hypothetical protein
VGGVMAVSPCRMMDNQIDSTTSLFGMSNGMPKQKSASKAHG